MEKLECGLRDELIAAQSKDLSPDELHNIGLGYMKDWSLYGDGYAARTAKNSQPQAPQTGGASALTQTPAPDGGAQGIIRESQADNGANVLWGGDWSHDLPHGAPVATEPDAQHIGMTNAQGAGTQEDDSERGDEADYDTQSKTNLRAGVVGGPAADAAGNISLTDEPLDIGKEITQRRFKNLEHGDLAVVHGIVLHRTATSTGQSVLNAYGAGQATGAHFLVDENGNVYQTAGLSKQAYHVGNIHRRCETDDSCSADDDARFAEARGKAGSIQDGKRRHARQMQFGTQYEYQTKDYPDRFPYNGDSIGIEVVGKYNPKTGEYTAPTQSQLDSIHRLVSALQKRYGLTNDDVYTHGGISYKMPSEGSGLGYD